MPSEKEALFRAILAHPEDDDLRLVYADWLEEHGEPERAALIRTQIELPKLPLNDARRTALADREEDLLRDYEATWRAELPTHPTPSPNTNGSPPSRAHPVRWGRWQRGFIDEVQNEHRAELAPWLCQTIPFQRLDLHHWNTEKALLVPPVSAQLRELTVHELYAGAGGSQVSQLFSSPIVQQLTHLHLKVGGWTTHDFHQLAQAPLRQLRSLTLHHWPDYNFGQNWTILLAAAWLPRLETLVVERTPGYVRQEFLRADDLSALRMPLASQRLRSLRLIEMGIDDAGAAELVRGEYLSTLRHLDLTGNEISQTGARLLLHHLPPTLALSLNNNPISATVLRTWLTSPHVPQPLSLALREEAASLQVIAPLFTASKANTLRQLVLTGGRLTAKDVKRLLSTPRLAGLRTLTLDRNGLPTFPSVRLLQLRFLSLRRTGLMADVSGMFTSELFPAVEELNLSDNPLGTVGAQALAKTLNLPRLQRLSLERCGIYDEGAHAWLTAPLLAQLRELRIKSGNTIHATVLAKLAQRAAELGCQVL